jgi:hypothetical protein
LARALSKDRIKKRTIYSTLQDSIISSITISLCKDSESGKSSTEALGGDVILNTPGDNFSFFTERGGDWSGGAVHGRPRNLHTLPLNGISVLVIAINSQNRFSVSPGVISDGGW